MLCTIVTVHVHQNEKTWQHIREEKTNLVNLTKINRSTYRSKQFHVKRIAAKSSDLVHLISSTACGC